MTDYGHRRAALLPPFPRLRLAAAALVLGAAFAGAAILHDRHDQFAYFTRLRPFHPEWEDPVALALCTLGLAVAAGVLLAPRLRRVSRARLAVAVLTLGAALLSASILGVAGQGPVVCRWGPPCFRNPAASWVDPVALALCILGLAGAAGVLATRHRH